MRKKPLRSDRGYGAAVICHLLGLLAFVSYRRARIATVNAERSKGIALRAAIDAETAKEASVSEKLTAEKAKRDAFVAEGKAKDALAVAQSNQAFALEAAHKARIETIKREVSQAISEFKISPTRPLLLGVEALNASKREQLDCQQ